MRKFAFTLLTLVAFALFTFSLSEAKVTVKYAHVAPPVHGQFVGSQAFANYVTEKTKGEIEVQIFGMGQLGGERSLAEQVQAGTLHMAAVSTAVLSNFVPQVAVYDLPFVYPDRETAYRTVDDKEVMERFFKLCEPKGFVAIGYTENELRDVTNSKRAIRKPEDLKGLKIRTMESPICLDTFRALGTNPVGLPFPEIYNALQQKVIDGQENPFYTSVLMKFIEVNKYATLLQHMLTECYTILSRDFWGSLNTEQKRIFREAVDLQIKVNREENAKNLKGAIEKAKGQGVEILTLTPAEREEFKKAVKPIYDKYRGVVGAEHFDFFVNKVSAHSKK
jgi:tripartite ATP-independent transporter DctP family solute receptor